MYSELVRPAARSCALRSAQRALPHAAGAVCPAGRSGRRAERAVRRAVHILVRLLTRPEALTLSELCTALGASRRTVLRDVQLLREIGLPIGFDRELGHYFLLKTCEIADGGAAAASLEPALHSTLPLDAPPASGGAPWARARAAGGGALAVPRGPEALRTARPVAAWPFSWEESVSLLALLRASHAPAGSEWHARLEAVDAKLKQRVCRAFGRKGGTVLAHAALLAWRPYLSLSDLRLSIERCWRCRMEPD